MGIEVARSGVFPCKHNYTLILFLNAVCLELSFQVYQGGKLAIGSLNNESSAITRLELAYALHILSQFLHDPLRERITYGYNLGGVMSSLERLPNQGILLLSERDINVS